MKIAVATMDGVSLSQHFGQSKGFVVFEVEGLTVQSRELRTDNQTPHNQGLCDHEQPQTAMHNHANIIELLSDCSVVLCGGMGAGAAQALTSKGIKSVILPGPLSADDALASYISGNAPVSTSGFCNCNH